MVSMQTILMLLFFLLFFVVVVLFCFVFFVSQNLKKKTEKCMEIQRLINAKFTGMVVGAVCV